MKAPLLLLLTLSRPCAAEPTLVLHLATAHFCATVPRTATPGVGLRLENNWAAGVYRNSYGGTSPYAGYMFEEGPSGLFLGVATGYRGLRCARDQHWCRAWMPLVAPSVRWQLTPQTSLRLSVPSAQGVHLSLETRGPP